MLAKFLPTFCSLAKFSPVSQILQNGSYCNRALAGFLQTREMGRYYYVPRFNKKFGPECIPKHLLKKRPAFIKQFITPENQEFLQEIVKSRTLKPGESPLREEPWPRGEWAPGSRRTGLIAKKIGVYPMWTTNGKKVTSTLLQIIDNHVIRYYTPEMYDHTDTTPRFKGLGCIVVGADSTDPQLFTAQYSGLFKESGVMPKKKLTKFFITTNSALQPGTPLSVSHFRVGDYVDVHARSIGYGFQGVVKRWGFKGGPKGHGNTKNHRRTGCIGGGSKKAGVWKGKKMPGMMGQRRVTLLGLKVLRINTKYNVMWVKGQNVPGHVHHYIYITDCHIPEKLHKEENPPPFPTFYPGENEPLPEETYASDIHVFDHPTITYKDAEENIAKK